MCPTNSMRGFESLAVVLLASVQTIAAVQASEHDHGCLLCLGGVMTI